MMRNRAIGIAVLALSICAGISASRSAISNPALDDPADGVRAGSPTTSNLPEPPAAVVQVTAPRLHPIMLMVPGSGLSSDIAAMA